MSTGTVKWFNETKGYCMAAAMDSRKAKSGKVTGAGGRSSSDECGRTRL